MDPAIADSEPRRVLPVLRSVIHGVIVLAILAAGIAVMFMFKSMKKEVAKKAPTSLARRVDVIEAESKTVTARIVGHGTVRAKNVVNVVPQVSGRVTWVSPRFKAGHRVGAKELLFTIESETYQATIDQVTAERKQLNEQIGLLDKTLEFDRKRLAIATRSRDLADQEFKRVRDLYEKQSVGSRPLVEAAERTYLARENDIVSLNSAIDNHPIRVQEINAAIAAADARLSRARLDLDRTKIEAPFPARVARATVRPGQVVMAGMTAMGSGVSAEGSLGVLSDLRVLEIPVAIDNAELPWLPIERLTEQGEYVFAEGNVESGEGPNVTIHWVQSGIEAAWSGKLARLERFDADQRTMTLVVEAVGLGPTLPGRHSIPLEEGMFCEVVINGRAVSDVCSVPRMLLTSDRRVPLLVDGLLVLQPVEVVRLQGDEALVSGGVRAGSLIVKTPIANAVDGMKLEVRSPDPDLLSGARDPSLPPTDAGDGGSSAKTTAKSGATQ